MKKVIGNFKMNKTVTETKDYIMKFLSRVDEGKAEIVLCLPSVSLFMAKYLLEGSAVKLGGQNISDEEAGKNTGEISGVMLKDCGADYVILGHSERRAKFKENGKCINKKIKIALKNRLKVIFCIGESLTEKNLQKTAEVLKVQLEDGLKGLYENELDNIIIAYEPIWAIGSGKVPTVKEIEGCAKIIRKVVENDFSKKAAEKIEIVYGGSVDNKNCASISKIKELSGLLVGGACLDPINFSQLVKDVKN